MNRRIREKKAVRQALCCSNIVLPDIHGPEPRLQKKIRKAIERQVSCGNRQVIMLGDIFEKR